jgi:hypothetical protein
VPTADLPVSPGHPFYTKLDAALDKAGFFTWVQERLAAAGLLKGRTVAIDATSVAGIKGLIGNLSSPKTGQLGDRTRRPGEHHARRMDVHRGP